MVMIPLDVIKRLKRIMFTNERCFMTFIIHLTLDETHTLARTGDMFLWTSAPIGDASCPPLCKVH